MIRAFIEQHLSDMAGGSPPHSVHALGLDELRRPEVTVWSAWEAGELVGCGALKELDAEHVEIKAMRTAEAHRRKGIASTLLEHLLLEARRRHYKRVSLETSALAAFQPARRLYTRFGFERCGPFDDYADDPNSVFMTKELHAA